MSHSGVAREDLSFALQKIGFFANHFASSNDCTPEIADMAVCGTTILQQAAHSRVDMNLYNKALRMSNAYTNSSDKALTSSLLQGILAITEHLVVDANAPAAETSQQQANQYLLDDDDDDIELLEVIHPKAKTSSVSEPTKSTEPPTSTPTAESSKTLAENIAIQTETKPEANISEMLKQSQDKPSTPENEPSSSVSSRNTIEDKKESQQRVEQKVVIEEPAPESTHRPSGSAPDSSVFAHPGGIPTEEEQSTPSSVPKEESKRTRTVRKSTASTDSAVGSSEASSAQITAKEEAILKRRRSSRSGALSTTEDSSDELLHTYKKKTTMKSRGSSVATEESTEVPENNSTGRRTRAAAHESDSPARRTRSAAHENDSPARRTRSTAASPSVSAHQSPNRKMERPSRKSVKDEPHMPGEDKEDEEEMDVQTAAPSEEVSAPAPPEVVPPLKLPRGKWIRKSKLQATPSDDHETPETPALAEESTESTAPAEEPEKAEETTDSPQRFWCGRGRKPLWYLELTEEEQKQARTPPAVKAEPKAESSRAEVPSTTEVPQSTETPTKKLPGRKAKGAVYYSEQSPSPTRTGAKSAEGKTNEPSERPKSPVSRSTGPRTADRELEEKEGKKVEESSTEKTKEEQERMKTKEEEKVREQEIYDQMKREMLKEQERKDAAKEKTQEEHRKKPEEVREDEEEEEEIDVESLDVAEEEPKRTIFPCPKCTHPFPTEGILIKHLENVCDKPPNSFDEASMMGEIETRSRKGGRKRRASITVETPETFEPKFKKRGDARRKGDDRPPSPLTKITTALCFPSNRSNCLLCGKMIRNSQMDPHLSRHHAVRPYTLHCLKCNKWFMSMTGAYSHTETNCGPIEQRLHPEGLGKIPKEKRSSKVHEPVREMNGVELHSSSPASVASDSTIPYTESPPKRNSMEHKERTASTPSSSKSRPNTSFESYDPRAEAEVPIRRASLKTPTIGKTVASEAKETPTSSKTVPAPSLTITPKSVVPTPAETIPTRPESKSEEARASSSAKPATVVRADPPPPTTVLVPNGATKVLIIRPVDVSPSSSTTPKETAPKTAPPQIAPSQSPITKSSPAPAPVKDIHFSAPTGSMDRKSSLATTPTAPIELPCKVPSFSSPATPVPISNPLSLLANVAVSTSNGIPSSIFAVMPPNDAVRSSSAPSNSMNTMAPTTSVPSMHPTFLTAPTSSSLSSASSPIFANNANLPIFQLGPGQFPIMFSPPGATANPQGPILAPTGPNIQTSWVIPISMPQQSVPVSLGLSLGPMPTFLAPPMPEPFSLRPAPPPPPPSTTRCPPFLWKKMQNGVVPVQSPQPPASFSDMYIQGANRVTPQPPTTEEPDFRELINKAKAAVAAEEAQKSNGATVQQPPAQTESRPTSAPTSPPMPVTGRSSHTSPNPSISPSDSNGSNTTTASSSSSSAANSQVSQQAPSTSSSSTEAEKKQKQFAEICSIVNKAIPGLDMQPQKM